MKFFMRYLGMFMVICGVLLFGTLLGLSVFATWVVASPGGARWAIDWLPRAGIVELQVDQVEGRLLGPLQLEGVKLSTPGADVSFDHARLDWSPLALLGRTVRIQGLDVGQAVVTLRATPEPEEAPPPPSIPSLPINIEVVSLGLHRLELNLPPGATTESGEPPEPQQQIVENIALKRFRWVGAELSAEHIAAQHALSGLVEASLDAQLAEKSVDLTELTINTVGDKPMQLQAKGFLHLDNKDSKLDLNWSDLRWPLSGELIADSRTGKLHVEGQPTDLRLNGQFALGETAQIEAKGQLKQDNIDARLQWKTVQWPLYGKPQVASQKGALDFDGTVEAYRYKLDALLAAEGKNGSAQASGSGSLSHLILDALKLDVAKSQIEGKANINWKSDLLVDADLKLRNVNPALVAADWPGRLNGGLKATTRIRDGVPKVQFEVALADSKLRDYPLRLDAKGDAEGERVRLDALHLITGDTHLRAQGQVTPPFAVKAKLDSPDLVALWPGLGGSANLALEFSGQLDAPHLVAVGDINKLQYQDLSIQQISLDADIDINAQWKLDLKAQQLRGPTQMRLASVQLNGSAADHELRVSVDAEPVDVDLQASGALDRKRMSWAGQITQGVIAPAKLAPWMLEEATRLRADASSAQLEPACWKALDSRLCLQGLRDGGQMRGAMRVDNFDLEYLASYMPAGWTLEGGLEGTAVAEQRNGQWVEARADLSTLPLVIKRNEQAILSAESGVLQISETDQGTVATLRLPVKDGRVNLDATLAAGQADFAKRPLNARLDLLIPDLAILRIASTEIEHASGALEGRVDWSGTAAQPQAVGNIRLLDARVQLATPGIELTDIAADFGLSPDQSVQLKASAQSGGGQIRLDGNAQLGGDALRASIKVAGEDFQAANMTEVRAWIAPNLDIAVNGPEVKVKGVVTVPRAEITPVSFDSGVGPSGDQVIIRGDEKPGDPPASQLWSDVKVVLGDKVSFKGFGLKTRFEGDLRAIERPGRPGTGRGEIRMVGGHYKAYGQDLAIDTGKVIFNGGPLTEPAVEIRATRIPTEGIEVGVLVRGTLEAPDFQLYSTPAMPRERQLSWLVLGRSLEDGGGGDERQALANAALALGLSRTDSVANSLKGGLNLDDVSIGSAPGEDASQASLTVGKYLSPKLYVSYGVGLFQPGQVFKLLYDLGRGFKIATESGVQTGGDLLYSVESN